MNVARKSSLPPRDPAVVSRLARGSLKKGEAAVVAAAHPLRNGQEKESRREGGRESMSCCFSAMKAGDNEGKSNSHSARRSRRHPSTSLLPPPSLSPSSSREGHDCFFRAQVALFPPVGRGSPSSASPPAVCVLRSSSSSEGPSSWTRSRSKLSHFAAFAPMALDLLRPFCSHPLTLAIVQFQVLRKTEPRPQPMTTTLCSAT